MVIVNRNRQLIITAFIAAAMITVVFSALVPAAFDGDTEDDIVLGAGSAVAMLAGGSTHTLALKDDGTVWAWGYNDYGQLGDGTNTQRNNPVQVRVDAGTFLTGVISVAAGSTHSLALKSDGTVWAWGYNNYGSLGIGTSGGAANKNYAVQVKADADTFLTGVTSIAAGSYHSLALRENDNKTNVLAWGYNFYGQLGDGSTTNRPYPVQVKNELAMVIEGMKAIWAGGDSSFAMKNDGTLSAWGNNSSGQLGIGSSGNTRSNPAAVNVLTDVKIISSGSSFTVALKDDGTAWAWGGNGFGQLGDGTYTGCTSPQQVKGAGGVGSLIDVIDIRAGNSHATALKNDGTVWAWGRGDGGQLGNNGIISSTSPQQVKGGASGTENLSGVISIASCAGSFSLALKGDGKVFAWGWNTNGQLGDGTSGAGTNKSTPVNTIFDDGTPLILISGPSGISTTVIIAIVAVAAIAAVGVGVYFFVLKK